MTKPAQRFVTRSEAARRMGLSVATLCSWVFRKKGPAYVRTGEKKGKTLYAICEIERWQREHTVHPSKPLEHRETRDDA